MTHLSYGGISFKFGAETEHNPINVGPTPPVRTSLYKRFVSYGGFGYNHLMQATPAIGRYSKLRYLKDSLPPCQWACRNEQYLHGTDYYLNNQTGYDVRSGRLGTGTKSASLTTNPAAIASIGMSSQEGSTGIGNYPPVGWSGYPYISYIDLHGTVVGNKFKHPIGRSAYFNEVGQIATSQGNLTVVGVFDPPENKRYHYAYQVYYTKSGGTGAATGTSGSDGSTTAPNIFSSAAYDFSGDVGKYVKVTSGNNIGIFLITGFSGTDAVTDASAINESFETAAGPFTWELVTGPIAEYFVRRRRYIQGEAWAQTTAYGRRDFDHGTLAMRYTNRIPSDLLAYTTAMLHDRGASWWSLIDVSTAGYQEFGLVRLLDTGPSPWDPVYADGDITNMPTGILRWRHMDIDKNNKIWVATDDETAATGWSVFVIDPYPLDGGEPNSLNPDCLYKIAKQADMASAGLPTEDAFAVVCDNINGDGTHGRSWILCKNDASLNGGLWYSEDGGATMKGLVHEKQVLTGTDAWSVAGDGVTVTNDSLDSSLTTELVAGEWVTFQDGAKDESKRQVASITDDDTLVLTAATSFGGAQGPGLSMKKGAINSTLIGVYEGASGATWNSDTGRVRRGVDHDTDGRVYWVPSDTAQGICRFDPSTTEPVNFIDKASLSRSVGGTLERVHTLAVSRMPDPLSDGTSDIWDDNIWVGGGYADGMSRLYEWESYQNSGVATVTVDEFEDAGRPITDDDIGKFVRIYKSASGNDGTYEITSRNGTKAVCSGAGFTSETNICWELFGLTRYQYTSTGQTDDFPRNVFWNLGSNDDQAKACFLVQDRVNGTLALCLTQRRQYQDGITIMMVETGVPTSDPSFGSIYTSFGAHVIYSYYNSVNCQSEAAWVYDDIGMGSACLFGFHQWDDGNDRLNGRQWASEWSCLLWNGSAWVPGQLNGHLADIDFDATDSPAGPHAPWTPSAGNGTRRTKNWAEAVEHGLALRFDQAGGGTSQQNEFVADENTTFIAAIGRVKDNTMTADWSGSCCYMPTVVRLDEPSYEIGSPWTTVGGWDGGYVNNADDQAMPLYTRGLAEGEDVTSSDGSTPGHRTYWGMTANSPANPQIMCAMRIHDEYVKAAGAGTGLDIFTVGGVGKATASEGAIFTTADVGKTVRVEGATNVTNNTSRVITALDGASPNATVILDAPWPAADENDLAWRLRDIPEVSYVAYLVAHQENTILGYDYRLYSSRDAGKTWDQVKWTDDIVGFPQEGLFSSIHDPGVYLGRGAFMPAGNDWDLGDHTTRFHHIFDLTVGGIDSSQRRRTHWKVARLNPCSYSIEHYPIGMLLLDNNLAPVIHESLMPADRPDPLWFGQVECGLRAIMHESAGAVTIGQSQTEPISFGDIVNEAGAGYWIQSWNDLKTYANSSKVTSALAAWDWQDVGRKLRAPDADITLGVEETYSGFLTIVTIEDANTATVERVFESQASGSFTTVTDNGGQAQFNAAGHTLANGDPVTIDGAGNVYDGTYVAANVVAGVSFEIGVAYSATDAGTWDKGQIGLDWATLNFGATDRVRFDDQTVYTHLGRPHAVQTYEIVDIPTTNQIQVAHMEIPIGVTDSFSVERAFTALYSGSHAYSTNFEDGELRAYYARRTGIRGVNDDGQFNHIAGDDTARTAAAGADSDNDGWSDSVVITGFQVDDAQAGDWLLLYNPSATASDYERRWYKIKTVSAAGGNTTITTYEDEITPSETYKWKIARKRAMKMRDTYCVVSTKEPI